VSRVSIPTGFFLRTLLCIEILPHKDKHASVDIVWLIPVILAEYFEIWIIESNLNGYCLNCSESQSSAPGRTNLYYATLWLCEVKTVNVNIRMELSSFVQNIYR
jgi:hypothetical protein